MVRSNNCHSSCIEISIASMKIVMDSIKKIINHSNKNSIKF